MTAGGVLQVGGNVEMCNFGTFYTVCDQGWDSNEARVVCRLLELLEPRWSEMQLCMQIHTYIVSTIHGSDGASLHTEGTALNGSFFGTTSAAYVTNVDCTGGEVLGLDCGYEMVNETLNPECLTGEHTAGVICERCELMKWQHLLL